MCRRSIIALSLGMILTLSSIGPALADPASPSTGQPDASCGSPGATSSPPGFNSSGFMDIATAVYAGSFGTPSLANGSPVAVSQYDVACLQVTGH